MFHNNLRSLYESGKTILEISDLTEITKSSCYRTLKLEGTKFRKIGRRPKINPGKILDLRRKGDSYRDIALKFGISHVSVFNSLRKARGVPTQ
jgi:hypothetical protein